jgi:nitrite reductase (NADH) large subunit
MVWRRRDARERLLIIGNGMASVRLCEEIASRAPDRYALTIVGAEPRPGYNRVLLSSLLAGEATEQDIELRDEAWYRARNFTLITGAAVASLEVAAREAVFSDGRRMAFDRAVFATGAVAACPPIPGVDRQGVHSFRDLRDLAALREAAANGRRVVVVGGGLLGIEAASGLAKAGAQATLIHVMDGLMERQLDRGAALLLKRALERKGVTVKLRAQVVAVAGDARAAGLIFADGTRLDADLVVFAVGVRPNATLAQAAGIKVGRGIVIDDALTASFPFVHAIGDCAEHRGVVSGLIEPAYEQARILAMRLCGDESARYNSAEPATNLKVSGVPVFSVGDFLGGEGTDKIVLEDRAIGVRRSLVLKKDRLIGAALIGDVEDGLWYRDLIRAKADVGPLRDKLIFGRAFCGLEGPGESVKDAA